ncbi:MAG: LysM peptidoglycan-binding domain-containing protein [Saprospiraceae bacterium]|nr:LysM peptidoglycan-binding domain-containing protein [Saprospiraceae bacterium]
MSKGETLYVIAQKNGIRLENLMSKNNIPPDAEPLQGEVLSLNKNLSKRDSPKYRLVERTDVFVDFGSLQ